MYTYPFPRLYPAALVISHCGSLEARFLMFAMRAIWPGSLCALLYV